MIERVCQSCAMPMGMADEMYGTNKDGSKSQDYCKFCYQNGEFLEDVTMEEMMKICIDYTLAYNDYMDPQDVVKLVQGFFPELKRWKK